MLTGGVAVANAQRTLHLPMVGPAHSSYMGRRSTTRVVNSRVTPHCLAMAPRSDLANRSAGVSHLPQVSYVFLTGWIFVELKLD